MVRVTMTIAQWLIPAMIKLKDAGVDSPRRDCLVLLEDTIQKDRAWVTAHPEHKLDQKVIRQLNELIAKRANREPLAYIRGKAWFYRRFFAVTPDVLIPRPETETMIELLLQLPKAHQQNIIDIGTGSGALAITAKLELPGSTVTALDISKDALAVAKKNAQAHSVVIDFVYGAFLQPLKSEQLKDATLLVNLPYVPANLVTSPEITQEPPIALFSGDDGMEHYAQFWQDIGTATDKPAYILTESLESQHDTIEKLAEEAGYTLTKTDILIQQFVRE